MKYRNQFTRDYETIKVDWKLLKYVERKYKLHLEVLLFAIQNIRENPKLTFMEAIDDAARDWIK